MQSCEEILTLSSFAILDKLEKKLWNNSIYYLIFQSTDCLMNKPVSVACWPVGGDFLPMIQVKPYEKHINLLDKIMSHLLNVITSAPSKLKCKSLEIKIEDLK